MKIDFVIIIFVFILVSGCSSEYQEQTSNPEKNLLSNTINSANTNTNNNALKSKVLNIDSIETINSIFEPNIIPISQINKCELIKSAPDFIKITKNDEKPDEYGFYNGPYKIQLKYKNLYYNGYCNEAEVNFNDSKIIEINDSLKYIFVRWHETPDLCEYSYSLFSIKDLKLVKISNVAYGCDI